MSGTTRVSRYQKGKTRKVKTNLDLLEQEILSGSGICWAICKSAPHPRQPHQHPRGNMHKNLVKFKCVVFKLCERTNKQTKRQTHYKIATTVLWPLYRSGQPVLARTLSQELMILLEQIGAMLTSPEMIPITQNCAICAVDHKHPLKITNLAVFLAWKTTAQKSGNFSLAYACTYHFTSFVSKMVKISAG